MTTSKFSKIQFGDGLTVTDQGSGVVRVDGGGGGGGGGALAWQDVGTVIPADQQYLPYMIFKGNVLAGTAPQACIWDTAPWAAYSPSGPIATIEAAPDNRQFRLQLGVYLAAFQFDSGANFALYQTGAATMSDYLQTSVSGPALFPFGLGVSAGATWMGSNDGFNRWYGEVNLVFQLRATDSSHNTFIVHADYLRAAGAITPNFSMYLMQLSL